MERSVGDTQFTPQTGAGKSQEWVRHVIALLDAAARQLGDEQAVHGTILKAAALLRSRFDSEVPVRGPDTKGALLGWQERKVRAYIDEHIAGPVLVANLCGVVRLSEAHFSRAFRRAFGKPPHAFVVSRRVELAAQCMIETEAPLSDIALCCGFTDRRTCANTLHDTLL